MARTRSGKKNGRRVIGRVRFLGVSYNPRLLCRHQRMRDGVDREGDAVLDSDFAHQFGHVRFDGAFFDAEGRADFFVRATGYQHLQHFFFAVGEGDRGRPGKYGREMR